MRIERTAKTVIAGLMSVACLASVAACGPGSSSNKANTETEAVSTDLGDTKYELKLWDGAGLKTFDDQLIEAFLLDAVIVVPYGNRHRILSREAVRILLFTSR